MHDENSALLRAVRVYRWLFSGFGLIAPPLGACCTELQLLYGLYVLGLMVMAFCMTYRISTFIGVELSTLVNYPLDNLTKWLSITLSVTLSSVQMLMQLRAIWNRRKSHDFYSGVAALERDLSALSAISVEGACALKPNGSGGDWRLHVRFIRHIGLLLLLLHTLFPYITFCLQARLLPFTVHVLTALQHLMVELKAVEYCVAVRLLHELLFALHADLWQLRRDLLLLHHQRQRQHQHQQQKRQRHEQHKWHMPLQLPLCCYAWRLQAHQQLVAHLWRLVKTLEYYYGFDLIVLFVYNGFDIVDTINWAFLHASRGEYQLIYHRSLYMLMLLLCLFVPCLHTQACINEYQRLGIAVHALRHNGAGDEMLADCLWEYSLQLQHLRLRFSCSGYFDMTLRHFGAFLLTVITYIIILLQFKLQA